MMRDPHACSEADAVRAATATSSLCTSETFASLQYLLDTRDTPDAPDKATAAATSSRTLGAATSKASTRTASRATSRATSRTTTRTTKDTSGTTAAKNTKSKDDSRGAISVLADLASPLSEKERRKLATDVVNSTLKVLTDALKQDPQTQRGDATTTKTKTSPDAASKRKGSPRCDMPLTELPNQAAPPRRTCLPVSPVASVAECSRTAFAYLRKTAPGNAPDARILAGMVALVGKLIAHGLDTMALEELRVLKICLERFGAQAPQADTTPEKESLASLLSVKLQAPSKDILALLVSHQAHVLKLIAASKRPSLIESALEHLDPSNLLSPSAVITEALRCGEDKDKSVRQLEAVARTLLSLCSRPASTPGTRNVEPKGQLSSDATFKLQTFALMIRKQWWPIAGHKSDLEKEMYGPLAGYLDTYRRSSAQPATDRYQTAQLLVERLVDIKKTTCAPCLPSLHMFSIYRTLGLLAQSCSNFADSLNLVDSMMEMCGDRAKFHLMKISCVLRALTIHIADSHRPFTLMATLVQNLKAELSSHLDHVEGLDILLLEISTLQRAAVKLLGQFSVTTVSDDSVEELKPLLCEIVFTCIRVHVLLLQQISKQKKTSGQEIARQHILKSIELSINSSLMVCRLLLRSKAQISDDMVSALLDCSTLARASNDAESHFANISNTSWLCHQQLLSHNECPQSQGLELLQNSVDLLRSRPAQEQELGFLVIKVEKLGSVLSKLNEHSGALDAFSQALDMRLETGSLQTLMDMTKSRPLRAATRSEGGLQVLLQDLRGFHQAAQQAGRQIWLYDRSNLGPAERVSMLEIQLYLLEQLMQSHTSKNLICHQYEELVKRLLETFVSDRHPLRRACCYISLLRLAKENVGSFDPDLLKDALEYNFNNNELFQDNTLKRYSPYIDTSLKLAQYLHDEHTPLQTIMDVRVAFHQIVDKARTCQELEECVDDIDTFVHQLKTMRSFMELKGQDESCLELLRLLARIHELETSRDISESVSTASQLAATYLRLGFSGRASTILKQAEKMIGQSILPPIIQVQLSLVKSQISFVKGDLVAAKAAALHADGQLNSLESISTTEEKVTIQQLRAETSFVFSLVNQLAGDMSAALIHAKRSVLLNQAIFAHLKRKHQPKPTSLPASTNNVDDLAEGVKTLAISGGNISSDGSGEDIQFTPGTAFWTLIPAQLRNLVHLCSLYAHSGHRFEAEYYANLAKKLASSIESAAATIQVLSLDAQHAKATGNVVPDSVITSLARLENGVNTLEVAKLQLILGDMYAKCQCWAEAGAAYDLVDEMMRELLKKTCDDGLLSTKQLPVPSGPVPKTRLAKTRPTPVTKAAPRKRAVVNKKSKASSCETETRESSVLDSSQDSTPIVSLRAAALIRKATMLILQKESSAAAEVLEQARKLTHGADRKVMQSVADARLLMLKSSEEVATDFTFNVLPESTLSFPALSSTARRKSQIDGPRSSLLSPPSQRTQQPQSPPKKGGRKRQVPSSFTISLFEARDRVWALQSEAARLESMPLCYQICEMALQSTVLLSAIDTEVPMQQLHPTRAALSMELPRIESVRRDLYTVEVDSSDVVKGDNMLSAPETCQTNLSASRFQQEYIDIIPESWAAVSLSMSEDCSELYIVRYEARRAPFILRLPMVKHKLQDLEDDETDQFDFETGRSELREIIELSDFSCHNTPGVSVKGASKAWWAEREALDLRMRELLVNIESIWFGGFRGILSQHRRDPSLLLRFRKSFEGILDRHLPSRQSSKTNTKRLSLDSNVLQLFIGLGNDQEGEVDMDEQLLDLLYFVIDVLQFNGERNAYDEVDFDSMATETLDALRAYHEAAASNESHAEDSHLILILDKRLHAFPWESMPCMESVNVSRVGSMLTLRERILAMHRQNKDVDTDRYLTARSPGAYILNPGSDLTNTQAMLEPLLQSIQTSTASEWTAMVNHAPKEAEFSKALSDSSMLLYFGHGSGNQYIRNRAIKRLHKCADVVWLMGCSSGTVAENGEFEPTSVPLSYMAAGRTPPQPPSDSASGRDEDEHDQGRDGLCMAVVATLWDVTDKDIDRFSVRVGEEWGLWSSSPAGTSSSSSSPLPPPSSTTAMTTKQEPVSAQSAPPKTPAKKSRAAPKTPGKTPAARARSRSAAARRDQDSPDQAASRGKSLVQAVVKGRQACHLKYLNGAAAVVYGVPVYLGA